MKAIFSFLMLTAAFRISAQPTAGEKLSNDTLSLEQRIIGLSQIWHEIKNDFAFFDKIGFDWDSAYKSSLKDICHTRDRFQYYQILRRLVASLRDGHTNVYLPKDLREHYLAFPPIRLKKVEERIFIQSLLNDTLATLGLSEKDEVLQVNGMEVREYGKRYIMPYVSASTQQDLLNRTYTNELLTGIKTEPLALTVRKQNGAVKQVIVSRALIAQRKPFETVVFKVLPQNIGLLTINTFDDTSLSKSFAAIMPKAAACKAMIVDLRRNGGGNGEYAYDLLDYLFEDHYFDTQPHSRIRISAWQAFHYASADNWIHSPVDSLKYQVPKKPVRFLHPLAVLISEKTFSAAEDFTATIKQNKRAVIIGTPSGGSTGMNVYHQLPGGGSFRLTIKKDTYTDGTEFVGVGIKPDIEVVERVSDFFKNKDLVLEAAYEHLKQQVSK